MILSARLLPCLPERRAPTVSYLGGDLCEMLSGSQVSRSWRGALQKCATPGHDAGTWSGWSRPADSGELDPTDSFLDR